MEAPTTREIRVRQLMTQKVYTISSDATLLQVMSLLRRHHVSGLPVTNGKHRVVGVISEKDIAKSLSEAGGSMTPEGLLEVFIHSRSNDTFLMSTRDDQTNPMHIFNECLRSVKVGDVMSLDPVVIAPDAPLDVAARMMRERRINRLPVVEGDRLVGILTRHDVLSSWP
jgi:CBS domain-containing protein